jgi:hypothetical protein
MKSKKCHTGRQFRFMVFNATFNNISVIYIYIFFFYSDTTSIQRGHTSAGYQCLRLININHTRIFSSKNKKHIKVWFNSLVLQTFCNTNLSCNPFVNCGFWLCNKGSSIDHTDQQESNQWRQISRQMPWVGQNRMASASWCVINLICNIVLGHSPSFPRDIESICIDLIGPKLGNFVLGLF